MKKGFTLLELLIVISITAVFLGVGFAGYRDFTRRQEVLVAKRALISDLRLAQKDASTGNKPATCTTEFLGYEFRILTSTPVTYEIAATCVGQRTVIKTANLSSSISLVPAGASTVTFRALGRGASFSTGVGPLTYTLSSSALGVSGTNNQTVTITANGEIR